MLGFAAIELGGNRRFRFLTQDAKGDYAPTPGGVAGTFSEEDDNAQLNLTTDVTDADGSAGWAQYIPGVAFSAGNDVLSLANVMTGGTARFARIPASPANGSDNPPPLSTAPCSLEGTWDMQASQDGPNAPTAASVRFDAAGNWWGGAYGKDVCSTQFMWGTYERTSTVFTIVTGYNMGPGCRPNWGASYGITFDASCQHAQLTDQTDGCTGARQYFMMSSTMTKR
jgi:hypothetical protein